MEALAIIATLLSAAPAGGERFTTGQGPVHVYRAGEGPGRGLVVYVHGYYVDVDEAVRRHGLFAQFHDSRLDATFVAVEAPSSNREQCAGRRSTRCSKR